MSADPVIYLVAGEPSGDRLGGALMRALQRQAPGVSFAGVGGQEMQAAGLQSLFDMGDLTVMGITEVVPRLPTILRRMRETVSDILAKRPAALITVDAPSFGLRVAAKVRAAAPQIRTIHYVAPSVWAWRPGRAKHMARFVDHVLALLPFEPPYMTVAGMSCDFVGHPIAGLPPVTNAAAKAWLEAAGVAGPLLVLAPGSRRGELARLGPVFRETVGALAERRPDLSVAIPIAETVAAEATALAESLPVNTLVLAPSTGEEAKRVAFAAADAALVASGTITLEMAAARTPHVSCYKTSALTAFIARHLIRVDTGHLVNLVMDERIVPERLQEDCTPSKILPPLDALLEGGPEAEAQCVAFDRALERLGRGGPDPAERAAASVLSKLG